MIVLTDSTIEILWSCGVNFEKSEIFRFLWGLKVGFPQKIYNSWGYQEGGGVSVNELYTALSMGGRKKRHKRNI